MNDTTHDSMHIASVAAVSSVIHRSIYSVFMMHASRIRMYRTFVPPMEVAALYRLL
jgi:hypothetical protein